MANAAIPTELPKPERTYLRAVKAKTAHCERRPLFKRATQTVFGEGQARARVILIGEQPGDHEDRVGA